MNQRLLVRDHTLSNTSSRFIQIELELREKNKLNLMTEDFAIN